MLSGTVLDTSSSMDCKRIEDSIDTTNWKVMQVGRGVGLVYLRAGTGTSMVTC